MAPYDPLSWLLEPSDPSARYLTLTTLLGRQEHDPDVISARSAIPGTEPARAILDAQWPGGYWMRPGIGYSPRHKATVWQLIFLAGLGVPRTPAVDRACLHVLENSRLADGAFSAYKSGKGAILCLNGNLLRALLQVGFTDARVGESLEALGKVVERDGFRCRFNGGRPPPRRMRDGLPCVWGAIKTLGAFAEVPLEKRSSGMLSGIERGLRVLLASDPLDGDFPTATLPSPVWLRFGFPLGYTSDLLEALEVLCRFGLGGDPRLQNAIDFVLSRRNADGTWNLDYAPDNTWAFFGRPGTPNKWITLRALQVLKAGNSAPP